MVTTKPHEPSQVRVSPARRVGAGSSPASIAPGVPSGAEPSLCDRLARAPLCVFECVPTAEGSFAWVACNPAAERLVGCDRAQLVGRPIGEAFPCLAREPLREALLQAAAGGPAVDAIEIPFGAPDGERMLVFSAFADSPERLICWMREATELARGERWLRGLLAASSAAGGPSFLKDLAISLRGLLGADVAFVGELARDAPHRMVTLALAMDSGVTENIAFDVEGSACHDVLFAGLHAHRCGLTARYPNDLLAHVTGCEAFVGVPLVDSLEGPLGVLGVLFAHRCDDVAWVESALRTLAPRVAGEIEHARVQATLRESEQRFRAFVQNSADIIVVVDYGGIVSYASPSVERVLGYSDAAVVGRNALDLVHPDDAPSVQARLVDLAQRRTTGRPIEVRLRHADGRWIDLELMGENLLLDPVVRGFLVTARDISDRKAAEEALRVSERRFRSYFDNPLVGAIIWLPDGSCVEANERMCRMLGYSREELVRMRWADVTVEEDRAADADALEQARTGRLTSFTRRKRYRGKDGATIAALVSSRCVYGSDGVLDHIVTIVEDLDERRRFDEALRATEGQYNLPVVSAGEGG